MKHAARIFITLIGMILIIYSIASPLLGVFGEYDNAVITSIRRQGGERDETIRGRYNYSIGYTFSLSDGSQINGTSTYVGDAVYLKADGTSTIPIRYLKQNPYINLPGKDTVLSFGQFIIGALGVFIIYVVNKKTKKHSKKQQS